MDAKLVAGIVIVIAIVAAAALLMGGGGGAATTTAAKATTTGAGTASPATTTAAAGAGQAGGKGVIVIGGTLSLQGKFAHEGHLALCGFKTAKEWINSHGGVKVGGKTYKLDLKIYDDKSSKTEVQKLYTKLITEDKVDFLMAPYSSGLTLAAAPIAEQYHKVILSHGGASDAIFAKGYKYIVQVISPASKYLAPAVEMIAAVDPQAKIAFIYEDSAFSKSVVQAAKKLAQEKGLQIVFEQKYPKGTTEFGQIIAKAKESGATVLLGGGHFQDGLQLVKQAHDLGWRLKFIAILVAPSLPEFYKQLGPQVADGVAYPSQWEPAAPYSPDTAKKLGYEWYGPTTEEFIQLYKQVCNGEEPDYHAASAAAAILYLAKAIERAGSLDSDKVRQAFNDLKLMTFFGPLKIDPATGKQVAHPMLLVQWQHGEKKIIWPREYAQAQPIYPVPNWWGQG